MTGWPRRARARFARPSRWARRRARGIVHAVAEAVGTLIEGGYPPVILTTAGGPRGPQGPDAGRLAAAGGALPARDSAGYAASKSSGKVVEEEPRSRDDLHDDGGARMSEARSPVGAGCLEQRGKAGLMRSKTYRASTMKEAMTRVRRDLGGDAVILSAREVRRRRLFGLGPRVRSRGHGQRHHARRTPRRSREGRGAAR